jgi:membrane protein YqaA with SNARE-associated domain
MRTLRNSIEELVNWSRKLASRDSFPTWLAAIAAVDLFVSFFPVDALVTAGALARPKRWFRAALFASLGSAIGAVTLGALTGHFGAPIVQWLGTRSVSFAHALSAAGELIDRYGPWMIGPYAASFLPLQAAAAVYGLTHGELVPAFLAIAAGRFAKYGLFAYLASHAPSLIPSSYRVQPDRVLDL